MFDGDPHGARVRLHAHVGHSAHALPEDPSDFAAGRVVRVQHAAHAVRPLERERGTPIGIAIEGGAPLDQLANIARALFDQHRDRALVTESIARGERVGEVPSRAVVRANGRGDTALRVAGISCERIRLGENEDIVGAGERHRGPKRRDAAADDEEVGLCTLQSLLSYHSRPPTHAVNRFERRGAGSHRYGQPQRPLPDRHRTGRLGTAVVAARRELAFRNDG